MDDMMDTGSGSGADEEVFTVAEIEEGWGLSRKLVLRAIWAGELVPVGCGEQGWLVSLADLGKWILGSLPCPGEEAAR